METKLTLVCSKCTVEKLTEDFQRRKDSKTGFRSECKSCIKIYKYNNKSKIDEINKKSCIKNKERIATRKKLYRQNNKELFSIYHEKNKEKIAETKKKWREENKESITEREHIYWQNNSHKRRAKCSRRRAKKLQACPPWLTKDDRIKIEGLFAKSKQMFLDTGIKHNVDHIHPLNPPKIHYFEGEWIGEICGLEVPCNLRVITESQNCSKSNKFQCYVVSDLDLENLNSWEII